LEAREGKGDAERRGEIMLRLMAIGTAEAGIIALCNAQLDLECVEPTVELADCTVVKVVEAVADAGPVTRDLSNMLENLVMKLKVFMWMANEMDKVNRLHWLVICLTDLFP